MRLLDRYLLRELLVPFAYCLAGFLVFWISFDVFAELNHFQEQKFSGAEIASYYVFKVPEFLVLVLPIALLLALLYALTNHARHNELTAIRNAGVSLMRLCLPYLAIGFVISLVVFALNELWVPRASQAAEDIFERTSASGPTNNASAWHSNLFFRNARAGRIWSIGAFNLQTAEMRHPHVEWQLSDGSWRKLEATNAIFSNGVWTFHEVEDSIVFPALPSSLAQTNPTKVTPTHTNVLAMPEFSETPEQIHSEIKITRLTSARASAAKEAQLSLKEILHYIDLHPDLSAQNRALLFTQLHGRIATSWTAFVVVLIAIPFGAVSTRRNAFVGVASSIFIAFAYFILMRFGLALGTGGFIPPWLAAWCPNLVFAVTGLSLAARVR